MGAETAGQEQTKDGLAIQQAILSLMRAHGAAEATAQVEEPRWTAAARPDAGTDEASENPETVINLLCAIQSTEIGARLRAEGRDGNGQSRPAGFDERALLKAIQATDVAAHMQGEPKQGSGRSFASEFDGQALLEAVPDTETMASLEGEISRSKDQAPVPTMREPATAASDSVADTAQFTASDTSAVEALVAESPSHLEQQDEPAAEIPWASTPAEPLTAGHSAADRVIEHEPASGVALDGLTAANASLEIAGEMPGLPAAGETAPPSSDEAVAEPPTAAAPATDASETPEISAADETEPAAEGPAGSEGPLAETWLESDSEESAVDIPLQTSQSGASREAQLLRITRRSSIRARRKRIGRPLRILEIQPASMPAPPQPAPASTESQPQIVPASEVAPPEFDTSVTASFADGKPEEGAASVADPAAVSTEEASQSEAVPEAAPSEDELLLQPAAPAEDGLPEAPVAPSLESDESRTAVVPGPGLIDLVPGFARTGARSTTEANPLAWTADVTAQCLDRAEMQLETWFLKWFEPPDPRQSCRLNQPPLVAYHWIVDSPQALKIANISSGGLYLVTEDRWSEGNIISMSLQRTDRENGSPESWIAVDFVVMRWCRDGVAGAFLPSSPGLSDAVAGRAKNCADKKTLERFVKELASLQA